MTAVNRSLPLSFSGSGPGGRDRLRGGLRPRLQRPIDGVSRSPDPLPHNAEGSERLPTASPHEHRRHTREIVKDPLMRATRWLIPVGRVGLGRSR